MSHGDKLKFQRIKDTKETAVARVDPRNKLRFENPDKL